MKSFRIQRKYTAWEEVWIDATSAKKALEEAQDNWDEYYTHTVADSFEYSDDYYIEEG